MKQEYIYSFKTFRVLVSKTPAVWDNSLIDSTGQYHYQFWINKIISNQKHKLIDFLL